MTDPDGQEGETPPRDPYAPPDPNAPPVPPQRPWQRQVPPVAPHTPASGGAGSTGRPGKLAPANPAGRRALLLSLAAPLVTALLFPSAAAVPLGLVVALTGVVAGVRARRQARRTEVASPGATAAVVAGALGVVLTLLLGAALLLFRTELTDYEECVRGANTRVAASDCQEQLQEQVRARTGARP